MHIAIIISSVLLIAEFVMAPFNLWSGHTMPNFTKFTGLKPEIARTVFAPLKLIGALGVLAGFWVHQAGVVGASILGLVCLAYLVRLSAPTRRDPSGIFAFAVGLACAAVVVAGRL